MSLPARLIALLLLVPGLTVLGSTLAVSPATALTAPVVDPPKCFPRFSGYQTDCEDVLPNGTYGPFGMSASIHGTATPGNTFRVEVTPRVPACTSHEQRGCYDTISHHHDGGLFYMPYANHLHTQRAVKWVEGPMSTHAPTLRSVLPDTGDCRADWQHVYADGGDFAARATLARTCVFRFKYQNAAGEQVPLDNLQGPTWLRIRSSVTVRKPGGGIEGETMTSLVRVDGELARGPVARCVPPATAKVGVRATFRSESSVDSDIDSVATWAFQPGLVPEDTYHGGTSHTGWAHVVPTAPGTLRATLTLQSWQGTSQSVCSIPVAAEDGSYPEPDPGPESEPTPEPTRCALSGSPRITGKARVGKRLKVAPGGWRVPGGKLTYQWKAGKKKIGVKAKVKLKQAHLKRKVRVTVTATAPDCTTHRATLRAGKVKRRR